MKKIIVAILAFLYLGVSSGIAMEIHYCMGKKSGVELYGAVSDKCGKCGMKDKKSGCCSDKYEFYKLNDSHKNVSNDISFEIPVLIVLNTFAAHNCETVNNNFLQQTNIYPPPVYSGPSACILNCIFRL